MDIVIVGWNSNEYCWNIVGIWLEHGRNMIGDDGN